LAEVDFALAEPPGDWLGFEEVGVDCRVVGCGTAGVLDVDAIDAETAEGFVGVVAEGAGGEGAGLALVVEEVQMACWMRSCSSSGRAGGLAGRRRRTRVRLSMPGRGGVLTTTRLLGCRPARRA
jgi:hypothetical protein